MELSFNVVSNGLCQHQACTSLHLAVYVAISQLVSGGRLARLAAWAIVLVCQNPTPAKHCW
jgi:hypothetical protein